MFHEVTQLSNTTVIRHAALSDEWDGSVLWKLLRSSVSLPSSQLCALPSCHPGGIQISKETSRGNQSISLGRTFPHPTLETD